MDVDKMSKEELAEIVKVLTSKDDLTEEDMKEIKALCEAAVKTPETAQFIKKLKAKQSERTGE